jgi:hypothetical protein
MRGRGDKNPEAVPRSRRRVQDTNQYTLLLGRPALFVPRPRERLAGGQSGRETNFVKIQKEVGIEWTAAKAALARVKEAWEAKRTGRFAPNMS